MRKMKKTKKNAGEGKAAFEKGKLLRKVFGQENARENAEEMDLN
jgi:hypothetical protein